jgi:hypothetical protein
MGSGDRGGLFIKPRRKQVGQAIDMLRKSFNSILIIILAAFILVGGVWYFIKQSPFPGVPEKQDVSQKGLLPPAQPQLIKGISDHGAAAPEIVDQVITDMGPFVIQKLRDRGYQIMLGRKELIRDDKNLYVEIKARFPRQGMPEIIVVEFDSGGNGCPAQFRFIDVDAPEGRQISDLTGNCSDTPDISLQRSVLKISFPKFRYASSTQVLYDLNTHTLLK